MDGTYNLTPEEKEEKKREEEKREEEKRKEQKEEEKRKQEEEEEKRNKQKEEQKDTQNEEMTEMQERMEREHQKILATKRALDDPELTVNGEEKKEEELEEEKEEEKEEKEEKEKEEEEEENLEKKEVFKDEKEYNNTKEEEPFHIDETKCFPKCSNVLSGAGVGYLLYEDLLHFDDRLNKFINGDYMKNSIDQTANELYTWIVQLRKKRNHETLSCVLRIVLGECSLSLSLFLSISQFLILT